MTIAWSCDVMLRGFVLCTAMYVCGCGGSLDPAGSNLPRSDANNSLNSSDPDGGTVNSTLGNDGNPFNDGTPPPHDATPPPNDGAPPIKDSAPPAKDTGPVPTDTAPPPEDTTPPPPGGNVGQACPCQPDLLCVDTVCRATCVRPTDPCEAIADCTADHACIKVDTTLGVCLPAAKPGGSCDNAYCPVYHICGAVNDSPFSCLPICDNPGGKCDNGSDCLTGMDGCTFCTKS